MVDKGQSFSLSFSLLAVTFDGFGLLKRKKFKNIWGDTKWSVEEGREVGTHTNIR